jgi:hypothetical protein
VDFRAIGLLDCSSEPQQFWNREDAQSAKIGAKKNLKNFFAPFAFSK